MDPTSRPEWHSRGYLPHGRRAKSANRFADSLPAALLEGWREELRTLLHERVTIERLDRIERALDQGHGSAALARSDVADLVERSLLHFDNERYRLEAWVIMPTHVHVLATPLGAWTLSAITQGWKSFTARYANRLLGREGRFWAPDYFDRAIRDERHFGNALGYIAMNPCQGWIVRGS